MKAKQRGHLEDFERTAAWGRYLFICDTNRTEFEKKAAGEKWWKGFAVLSYVARWYASLAVVIEGWPGLGHQNDWVEKWINLDSGQYALRLKNYRNAIYHYQPSLMEKRILAVWNEPKHMTWAIGIHEEFLHHLWQYPRSFPGTPRQKYQFSLQLKHMIGWMPDDIISAHEERLFRTLAKFEAMILRAGENGPESGKDSLAQIRSTRASFLSKGSGHGKYREHLFSSLV